MKSPPPVKDPCQLVFLENYQVMIKNFPGDLPSAIAYVALEEAINNNEDDVDAAAKELEETLSEIVEAVEEIEEEDDLANDVFDEE